MISPQIIRISEKDNVAVVANAKGIDTSTDLAGLQVKEFIPMGHKIALNEIKPLEAIVRYGQTIGYAIQEIQAGEWVSSAKIETPDPPNIRSIPLRDTIINTAAPLDGYTFEGYKNADGSVGTKNILAIATSVQCVAGYTQIIAKKIKAELLPKYPNVDDVVGLNHAYGCGIAIEAPAAIVPIRTLQNIIRNPNFGGEVVLIGLGCEKLRPNRLLSEAGRNSNAGSILFMQDPELNGFQEMIQTAMHLAERHLTNLNKRQRQTCPASDLVVGMQCGGSDAFSGITANPVAGFAADLIVRAGGSVMFSEVTEVRDAAEQLLSRIRNRDVAKCLIKELEWYDDYLSQGKVDRSANTTPGNKKGGLSTIIEKALGSIAKSGSTEIVDVIGPGERIRKKGLTFAATPAGDFVCGTLQAAAGMNVHVFMTGRGSPYGLAMVPTIKVSSNSDIYKRWYDIIDFNTGDILTGGKTIATLGWELFHLILKVASGKVEVACDKLGLHNDLVLFNPGPLT